jgi:hypothetical protein
MKRWRKGTTKGLKNMVSVRDNSFSKFVYKMNNEIDLSNERYN